jgi:uncharacterized small protein (DUF1192 family)
VQVFVDLYVKTRQLREQAELLRQRLPASGAQAGVQAGGSGRPGGGQGDRPGVDRLVAELSARLASVEEQSGRLASQAKVTVDAAMAQSVGQLEQRVARLRDALEALAAPR